VGIAKDVTQSDWGGEPDEEIWLPFLQHEDWLNSTHPWLSYLTLVIRTANDPTRLINPVRNLVWSANKNVVVTEIKTMEQVLSQALWQQRINLLLIDLFAAIALILVIVGIYGVMVYTVTQRTHEMGIRLALGAQKSDVFKVVVSQGMLLATGGVAIGLVSAFALTRLMTSLLYQVKATDPVIFAAVSILLLVTALFACYMPARRATKVDPMVALRYE
jgi:putative ABC transport system permease protein